MSALSSTQTHTKTRTAPTLVVVDDDPAVLEALSFAFSLDGYEVLSFATGEAVLCAPALPDLGCLVLDYRLEQQTGLGLLSALRRREVNLPAILITTQPSDAVRREAAEAGVVIVEKPLMGDALSCAVEHALGDAAP